MPEPFIFTLNVRVKEGKAERLREWMSAFLERVAEAEPRIVAFNVFFNEDETEMTSIQVHPDRASMDHHMEVLKGLMAGPDEERETVGEREPAEERESWFDLIEPPATVSYYGTPSDAALEDDRASEAQGLVAIRLFPIHVAGFTRAPQG